jgi:hypothetical protein
LAHSSGGWEFQEHGLWAASCQGERASEDKGEEQESNRETKLTFITLHSHDS